MYNKGITLVEIVISLLLLSFTAGMMADAFITGGRINIKNERLIIATSLCRELVEEVKARPFGEPIILPPLPAGLGGFGRSVELEFVNGDNFNEISPVETDFIRVTATVSNPEIKDVVFRTVINRDISPSE